MSRFAPAILCAALALGSASVLAQGNPSPDQIIKSLTPKPGVGTTRGIRLAHPGATSPSNTGQAPSVSLIVLFATGSADLTPDAEQTVDQLGHALSSQQLASYKFRIEGHTDTVGTPAYNLELSKRRAETVVSYLEQKFNIPGSRLEAVGMGEKDLLVQTPNETAEPRNRRVQVVNLGS
jgi:OmpA-OmpF porin, OOP family